MPTRTGHCLAGRTAGICTDATWKPLRQTAIAFACGANLCAIGITEGMQKKGSCLQCRGHLRLRPLQRWLAVFVTFGRFRDLQAVYRRQARVKTSSSLLGLFNCPKAVLHNDSLKLSLNRYIPVLSIFLSVDLALSRAFFETSRGMITMCTVSSHGISPSYLCR